MALKGSTTQSVCCFKLSNPMHNLNVQYTAIQRNKKKNNNKKSQKAGQNKRHCCPPANIFVIILHAKWGFFQFSLIKAHMANMQKCGGKKRKLWGHIVLFSQQRNENTLKSFAGKNFLLEFDKDDNRYNYSLSFIAQLMGFRFNEKWRIKLLLRTWWWKRIFLYC